MRILLVEDNETIILGLQYLLEAEGFLCDIAKNYKEAVKQYKASRPDIVLLDISLPDGDGFTLCRELKKECDIPVIFLTAKEDERDVVQGFELGADDYIIKPFRNRELVSRIRNVLRRNGKGNEVLKCGFLELDTQMGKVFSNGEEVSLTKLEYKILSVMMNHQGKLFTRDEILSEIWDASGNFVNDNTLSVTMKRIREKIGDKNGVLIKTVRGLGYRIEKQ
ncbi:MAG: response regulator transcription factor [Bacteroidales bacterium]|nr:response regulator transcription factor [Lachnoclostridium sp.]MCM1382907.1 response regulator transcription factor [Lachnoclostridium sp.]MCM1465913.1 response regulator transcription factor [Bacteroidales bacterium]